MGKEHLKYFSGCGIFCRWEQPIIAAEIVEVRELSLEEPELQLKSFLQ